MQIKINGYTFQAEIVGQVRDAELGNRASKSITLAMDYATAVATFANDVPWSILYQPAAYYDP